MKSIPRGIVPELSPGLVQRFVARLAQGLSREPFPQLLPELAPRLAQRLALELAPSLLAGLVSELDKIRFFFLATGLVQGLLQCLLRYLAELARRLPMLEYGFVPALDPECASGLVPMLGLVLALEGASFHSAGLVLEPLPGFGSEILVSFALWIAAGIAK